MAGQVRFGRVYEPRTPQDGARILVDRLWPRGLSKKKADLDDWCRDVAPSTELRKWYHHDPERFDEFAARYRAELAAPEQRAALDDLRQRCRTENLTLLTASKDVQISEAAVLAAVLGSSG